MPRPTDSDLATATYGLSLLASRHQPHHDHRRSSGFPDVAAVIDLLLTVGENVDRAREAAAYGPGVEGGVRTLPRGSGHGDIDARTRDPELAGWRRLEREFQHELGQMRDRWQQKCEEHVGQQGVRSVG